jgi:cyclopropane-fatty-acyl-phospholipid synthase
MPSVADALRPLISDLVHYDLPVRIRFWDGSVLGPPEGTSTVVVRSPAAVRRLLYAPNELGLGRAYVAGDIDIQGDVFDVLRLRELVARGPEAGKPKARRLRALGAALRAGALGLPLPPPVEEARLRGRRHSKARDAAAISHHYDVSNDFYRLVLGETMTYSCAYFASPEKSLDEAQAAKHDLVCRKLDLQPGMRLLDVGSGWGQTVIHAATHYGVTAVGVTVSTQQAELAEKRVADAGLADRVEIRLQDYRDVTDGPYDAISSVGMFEHVGLAQLERYFGGLFELLRGGGRLLNHGISRPPGPGRFDKSSFIARYVFPDGELHDVGTVVAAIEQQSFEVRHVESLREHYALTLRQWVRNLERNWDEAVRLAGRARARIWRLYMAGAAMNFEAGRNSVHQVLAVKPGPGGAAGMPPTGF